MIYELFLYIYTLRKKCVFLFQNGFFFKETVVSRFCENEKILKNKRNNKLICVKKLINRSFGIVLVMLMVGIETGNIGIANIGEMKRRIKYYKRI